MNSRMGFLPDSLFSKIVEFSPLVSIDIIITNRFNQILLGLRNNEPAKNFWFVPGGRILKDETIDEAFERIIYSEIGIKNKIQSSKYLGFFEHFYNNSYNLKNISTHYVVLAFHIEEDKIDMIKMPTNQHREHRWFENPEPFKNFEVHKYTREYFNIIS